MRIQWRLEIISCLILATMFAASARVWPIAPDRVPVHWNPAGEVDRFGGKVEGLLAVPLIALAMYVLFLVLPRFDPGRANYERFGGAYAVIRTAILVVLAVVHAVVIAAALSWPVDVARVMAVTFGGLFAVLGAVLHRVEPNWFVGIRTPWTLSSRRSWDRTHRVGSRVFLAIGLATAALGIVAPVWAYYVLIGGLGVGGVATVAYSYVVWRDDPDKVLPGGMAAGDR